MNIEPSLINPNVLERSFQKLLNYFAWALTSGSLKVKDANNADTIENKTINDVIEIIKSDPNLSFSEIYALKANLESMELLINNLINTGNLSKFKIDSPSNIVHFINHNLNSTELNIMVWVKDNGIWRNHIVSIVIVDENNIRIDLLEAYEIRVLIENFASI